VIPVLVNDAKMPRSADLPEGLKPFARCNAVRLTHERFRADTQGLIKALEHVIAEADVARRADEERAQRDAEAEAERRKRKRPQSDRVLDIRREAEEKVKTEDERRRTERDELRDETQPQKTKSGVVSRLAGLPSEISWHVPIGVVLVYVLGWFVPGLIVAMTNLGWGLASLFYALAGLLAVVVAIYLRRNVFGGAELAVWWFAAVSFFALGALSLITRAGFGGQINSDAYSLTPALITLAMLVVIRRARIDGLEASVYWLGTAIVAFWAMLPLLAATTMMAELDASLTGGNGYKLAGLTLAALMALSAVLILLWRWWKAKLSRPEATVYLLGIVFAFATAIRLV